MPYAGDFGFSIVGQTPRGAPACVYVVRGHWPFPLDMLRHDGSAAASLKDQGMIDRLAGESAPDRAAFKNVEISLAGPNKPNTARWESFGWAVPNDREHAILKEHREAARKEEALVSGALTKLTNAERNAIVRRMERC